MGTMKEKEENQNAKYGRDVRVVRGQKPSMNSTLLVWQSLDF